MGSQSIFNLGPDRLKQLLSLGMAESEADDSHDASASGPVPSQETPEKPGSWIGRYRLLRVLGEGGMGVVYLAEQEHPIKRQVALKVIKPGMDTKRVIARFEIERQVLALLDHPNIAHVYDAGTTDRGRPYFAMEYVEGVPITEYCDRQKLSIDERVTLFRRVCEAIHHAHLKGIIHRDIKSSNVLVSDRDGEPVAKVIDFGIARAMGQELPAVTLLTEQTQLLGTPEYMSPEQVNLCREDIDVRSDVYSLGVLLYVLLTGALPFDSDTLRTGGIDTIRHVIQEEDPEKPGVRLGNQTGGAEEIAENRSTQVASLIRRLQGELEWIPLKAMCKERDQRYQSAAALSRDVQNYLDGTPLIAGPPGVSYRIRKFVRRRRALVCSVGMAIAAVGIGAIISFQMYFRAEVQAQRSQAVSSFLNDTVLRALDPYRRQGGEITPTSVLDAVAAGLENCFHDAPLVEAEIRHRLGRTYEPNGRSKAAIEQLQRALDIRRRELGNRHPLTVETMHRLAWALYTGYRAHDAEPLFQEALAESIRQFGRADARTISIQRMLALTYRRLGKYDMARQLYEEALHEARRTLGPSEEITIYLTCGMGGLALRRNDLNEAEKWYREGLQQARVGLGDDHAVTWGIVGGMGWIYGLQGRYRDAELMLKDSMENLGRIFGSNHRRVLGRLRQLIRLYIAWNRPEKVAACWQRLEAASSNAESQSPGSFRFDPATNAYLISNAPSSGIGISDMIDEFYFVHKTLHNDGTISARIDGISPDDCTAEAGLMVRNTLSPTARHVSVIIVPPGMVYFVYRTEERGPERVETSHVPNLKFPYWISLKREGDVFYARHSRDGKTWESVPSQDPHQSASAQIDMRETVYVGMTTTSWRASGITHAQFADVMSMGTINRNNPFTESGDIGLNSYLQTRGYSSQTPSADYNDMHESDHLNGKDLRSVEDKQHKEDADLLAIQYGTPAGGLTYDDANDAYTIFGSGKDIWLDSDQFHFAHNKLDGDGVIATRVDSIGCGHEWAKAGLMVRDTTASNSAFAAVFITPEGRVCFQYRLEKGQNARTIHTNRNTATLPHWVRLVREGQIFSAQHSENGVKWQNWEGGSTVAHITDYRPAIAIIEMHDPVHVGLVVCSHAGPGISTRARMSNVTVAGDITPADRFLWSEDIGFRLIALPEK